MKPIKKGEWLELCPKCGATVAYEDGTGRMFHGASESYEEWRYVKHKYCPECGEKMEREEDEDE